MYRDGTDDDYYVEAADFLDGVHRRQCDFATKTPVVMLPSELYTDMRRDYYDSIAGSLAKGKLSARYCFALEPTAKRLVGLYSNDDTTRELAWYHLKEALALQHEQGLDLRMVPTADFTSGLVAPEVGMIHIKKPGTQETTRVDFMDGPALRPHRAQFAAVADAGRPLDAEGLRQLLRACGQAHLVGQLSRCRPLIAELRDEEAAVILGAFQAAVQAMERPTREELDALVAESAALRGLSVDAMRPCAEDLKEVLDDLVFGSLPDVDGLLQDGNVAPIAGSARRLRAAGRLAGTALSRSRLLAWHWQRGASVPTTESEAAALEADRAQYHIFIDRESHVWVSGTRAAAVKDVPLRLLTFLLKRVGKRSTVSESLKAAWGPRARELQRNTNVLWVTLSRLNRQLAGFYIGAFVRRRTGTREFWIDPVCEKTDERSRPWHGERLRYCLLERMAP